MRARVWLRWLAVLPAAALGAVAISLPVHWVILGTFQSGDAVVQLTNATAADLEKLAQAFFGPAGFVGSGAWVAPRSKTVVAVILSSLVVVFVALAPSLARSAGVEAELSVPQVVLNLLGAAVAAFVVLKSEPRVGVAGDRAASSSELR